MANYSYVVDSNFTPFTMQEMLVPFTAYKDAFEKTEEAYDTLSQKADIFKSLSEDMPEGSKARAIYEGYSKDLNAQAEDLANNGLTRNNRRALTSLKRRYQGEIGRLAEAKEALQEERKLRRSLNAQDPSRLYSTDNLNLDSFLDGNTPNLYSISGNDLYAKGAQAAKSFSSRLFNTREGGKTLGGYYLDWITTNGTSPESIEAFSKNVSAIPELAESLDRILATSGAAKNLSGYNLETARQNIINGMIDGAVYQEQHSPQRNLGVLTAAEQANKDMAEWNAGVKKDENGNYVGDPNNINYQIKQIEKDKADAEFNSVYERDGDNGWKYKDSYIQAVRDMKGKKKGNSSTGSSVTDDDTDGSEQNKKQAALLKADKNTLGNNNGFTITTNSNKYAYRYVGAITSHRKGGNVQWYKGKLGEDNPAHNGLIGLGMFSSSNVENGLGNLTAESAEDGMSVMSVNEINSEFNPETHPEKVNLLYDLIYDALPKNTINEAKEALINAGKNASKENIIAVVNPEFEVIKVPNEGNKNNPSGRASYLVALPQ